MDRGEQRPVPTDLDPAVLDRSRYRRVRRFFLGALLHALWWDVVMNRPLLRRFRPPPLKRWQLMARRYRELAVGLGGVLIKLGQFLSARVDILPPEVTGELAGLQDEVPPAPFERVAAEVEGSLGQPLDVLFDRFEREPLGAASLAQVHAARLPTGEEVVVKVLRPGVDRLVATDLAAFSRAMRWLKLSRAVRQRVDVSWVEREFSTVTRRELDLVTEGRSAERFAGDFAHDAGVVVPKVYWSHSGARALTLDNVAAVKVSDLAGLDREGVDRRELARRLYGLYMRQFFVTHFVHADPHPGNIFVRPVERPEDETAEGEGRPSGGEEGRPFAIAFVDFGMMTEIPERLRRAMREFAIGLGTRDARRIVQSYSTAGSLLPNADVERLVEAHQALLDRFWGVRLAEVHELALSEAQGFAVEFRDLIFSAPVQLQADMLFALRAVGLLAGLATRLDQDFNPWVETVPFAERFAREERLGRWRERLEEIGELALKLLAVPAQLDRLIEQVESGRLGVQTSLSVESRQRLERLQRSVGSLSWTVAGGALLVAGAVLRAVSPADRLAPWLLGGAAALALFGLLHRKS